MHIQLFMLDFAIDNMIPTAKRSTISHSYPSQLEAYILNHCMLPMFNI